MGEVTGERGSVEVTTHLWKWIEVEYAVGYFENMIVFSDNCRGLNNNINNV